VERERIRILADVYFLEIAGGAVIRNRHGSLEIMGKGAYQLLRWIFPVLDGARTYLDVTAALPAAVEQHVRAVVKRLLERRFARILPHDEVHDHPMRERHPELYNLLEYRTASVTDAWKRVQATGVAVAGTGTLARAVLAALPDYGLQAAPGATATVLAEDSAAAYQCAVEAMGADAAGLSAGLCRHDGVVYGLATHDRVGLPAPASLAAIASQHMASAQSPLQPPAALTIAAQALCLELFERIALPAEPPLEPRLLLVDESTLTLSQHRLPPRVLFERDNAFAGTPLAPSDIDGWIRPDLGGSILPAAETEALNAIARSVAGLTDSRVGPVLRLDDGDLFQLPLAAAVALNPGDGDGRPRRLLTLGLSARETRNQGALAALEDYYARRHENGPTPAAGWSRREALMRAGRALFECDAAAYAGGTAVVHDWARAPQALRYLAELFEDVEVQCACVRNRHGWYMASHPALTADNGGASYGVGVLPQLAIGDLLLKLALQRFYLDAGADLGRPVLLNLDLAQDALRRAVDDAMVQVEASVRELPVPISVPDACPLYIARIRVR